uniref:A-kinase-interacting protein 1 isoform X3 n=1 Tax=Nyctereutes procyonoides TaxID=34880 RepID=UPI002443D376|nr:A-kinase-interacting protein 1 isoform X3 [Nyctereutes procyonoides]
MEGVCAHPLGPGPAGAGEGLGRVAGGGGRRGGGDWGSDPPRRPADPAVCVCVCARAGRHGELLGGRGAERGGPTRPAAHGEAGSGGAGARQDEGGGLASAGASPKQRGGRFPGAARGRPPAPPAGTGEARAAVPGGPLAAPDGSREREERQPTLSASFRTMAAFMDYTSSQCGPLHMGSDLLDFRGLSREQKYYSSVLEEGGAAHVSRYHRGKSAVHLCWDMGNGQKKETSLDLGGISQASECALAASQPNLTMKDVCLSKKPYCWAHTAGAWQV